MKSIFIVFLCLYVEIVMSKGNDYNNFCKNPDGLKEIEANVLCKSEFNINSCEMLGGLVLGTAAGMTTQSQIQKLNQFKTNPTTGMGEQFLNELRNSRVEIKDPAAYRKELVDKINKSAYDSGMGAVGRGSGWDDYARANERYYKKLLKAFDEAAAKAKQSGQKLFEPIIQEILVETKDSSGRVYNVTKMYDLANIQGTEFPNELKVKYQQFADAFHDASKKPGFSKSSANYYAKQIWGNLNEVLERKTYLNQEINFIERDLPKRFTISFAEFYQKNMKGNLRLVVNSIVSQVSNKTMSKVGASVAGGVIGTGVVVAGELIDSTKTGCSTMTEQYITMGEDCKPLLQFSNNVRNFLAMDSEKQLEIFNSYPAVCNYYKSLHQQIYQRPTISKLNCPSKARSNMSFTTQEKDKLVKNEIHLSNDGSIQSIGVDSAMEDYRFNIIINPSDGKVKHYELKKGRTSKVIKTDPQNPETDGYIYRKTETATKYLNTLQLFLPEMLSCCSIGDPGAATSSACLEQLNSHILLQESKLPQEQNNK